MTNTLTKTIHWNTGAMYNRDGQRMSATFRPSLDGLSFRATFFDHARHIDGECEVFKDDASSVMNAYNHNRYASTDDSRQDGLYVGGVNAEWAG